VKQAHVAAMGRAGIFGCRPGPFYVSGALRNSLIKRKGDD